MQQNQETIPPTHPRPPLNKMKNIYSSSYSLLKEKNPFSLKISIVIASKTLTMLNMKCIALRARVISVCDNGVI